MQIVIDIDEELYDSIQYELHWEKVLEQNDIRTLLLAVDSGVVIPSGHGRLVDADKLHHCECKRNFGECDTCLDDYLCNLVNEAETIIEADKGE